MSRSVYILCTALALALLSGCPKKDDGGTAGTSASASSRPEPTATPSATGAAASATSAPPAGTTSTSVADSGTAKFDGGAACGGKTNPCPMQAWMKANANPAVASGDLGALAKAFDAMGPMGVPAYANWGPISADGAKAAREGKLDAAKAACRTCHDQYKEKYKAEFRDRKI